MWVYPCFEGDVDDGASLECSTTCTSRAASRPSVDIFGGSTLGFIWANVLLACHARRRSVPWIDRNWERLLQVRR